jgi:hypothetical protein
MSCVAHRAIQIAKTVFFVDGHGFFQFRHGFYIDLSVTVLAGKVQGCCDEFAAQPLTSCCGAEVHFYQFTNVRGQSRGRIDPSASGYLSIEQSDMVAAAGELKSGIHVVGRLIVIGRARVGVSEFGKGAPDDGGYGDIVAWLDRANEQLVHPAKLALGFNSAKRSRQQSDHAVENRHRDDDDSDKWPVRVLHKMSIDKREVFTEITQWAGE